MNQTSSNRIGASASANVLLQTDNLTKRYGSATVVDGCDVTFRQSEIHALLGANGAGKSTLVRMVAGLVSSSGGSMRLSGNGYAPTSKRDAESSGIEIVQQELNLIPTLSVAENLFLNRLPSTAGVIRQRELHERAREALDRFGLTDVATDCAVGRLGVGKQQMVEIAAALDRRCKLLILDEPTAALSAGESETLFDWLGRLRDEGVGIVYISHRLDEVKRLADRFSVLRDGRMIGTFETADYLTDQMVELMSGPSSESSSMRAASGKNTRPLLKIENISGGPVKDVSFAVHRGERFGIAGLVGSGRTELLRLIFGADTASDGSVSIGEDSSPIRFRHPADAVAAGLAMVTEDRKDNGLLLTQSIRFNTSIASLWRRFARFGTVRGSAENEAVIEHCESMEVRCESMEQRVGTLSGGNQQKVAIAKWLIRDADVFLFDEPTRGIDVAARRRIYRLMDALSQDGKAMVIVSSDLEELLETCDRIGVMSNGRMVQIFNRGDWSDDAIMQAAFSGYRDRRQPA